MNYAQNTEVSVEKSRGELERILTRYGAARFAYMSTESAAMIAFQAHGKFVKFVLPLPNRNDESFWKRGRVYRGSMRRQPEEAAAAWEQACRARWRALCLCVKAKLEAVACGITSFEQEFLAHFVMPNGQTVGEYVVPQLEEAAKSGRMPQLQMLNSGKIYG